jgi:hypothetical protein
VNDAIGVLHSKTTLSGYDANDIANYLGFMTDIANNMNNASAQGIVLASSTKLTLLSVVSGDSEVLRLLPWACLVSNLVFTYDGTTLLYSPIALGVNPTIDFIQAVGAFGNDCARARALTSNK